ncbi:MAG: radical SAM family heme chaperone HemW [Prevotella sp.]|nr:radical SAM family heme chaperone HemW [Prevotella sp.]
MAGIYIHIPFCASRCIYCAFYSTTSLNLRQRYIDALCREMESRRSEETISTIYLGGGTPSQLSTAQLRQLFDALYIFNNVTADAEVTIEVNPDDMTTEFAEELSGLPLNRVSMGVQTFDDERLKFLHRRHTAAQVYEAVQRLRAVGIHNISIDLMYGFPGETLTDWEHDIDAALALGVEHLSAYCLSIEEGTPLWKWTIDNEQWIMDEELERRMYYTLIDKLEAVGFEHYEISNFAQKGFRSHHNSSYWTGIPYLGLGAAAHSFNGHTRSWNVADIHQYIEGIEQGKRLFDVEAIEGNTRYNDLLTTALRTREGLDLSLLSEPQRDYCLCSARRFINDDLLTNNGEHLVLTRRGLFVSDMVISGLMLVND